jgi:epoxyqueuosine reductase
MSKDRDELTAQVKSLARLHGAVLVGVAPVERFDPMPPLSDAAPPGHHPRDFLPTARSVISFAQPILDPVLDAPAVLAQRQLATLPEDVKYPYWDLVYDIVGHAVQDRMLECIGQIVGQFLTAQGHQAMIFPTTGVHPRLEGKTTPEAFKDAPLHYTYGPFSHRHAATRAGLGEFGLSNVVLTREFGPRQRFNSIVTDADLTPDPLVARPICLRDGCRLCLKACFMHAITLRTDPEVRDCRSIECDDHRRIFIDTPSKSEPGRCMSRRREKPMSPVRGDCIRVCPVPRVRPNLPEHLQHLIAEWKGRGQTPGT